MIWKRKQLYYTVHANISHCSQFHAHSLPMYDKFLLTFHSAHFQCYLKKKTGSDNPAELSDSLNVSCPFVDKWPMFPDHSNYFTGLKLNPN